MTLLLRNQDLVGLMSLAEYITAIELGYQALENGRGQNLPRHNLWLEGVASEKAKGGHLWPKANSAMTYKGATLPALGCAGLQVYTWGIGKSIATYLLLFDTVSGELSAFMEVLYYDWLKTAAVSALATRYLAPLESSVAAIFGTGRHARSQLHGLCSVRPLQRIQAYSRNIVRKTAFCNQLTRELGVEVVPAASPQAAVSGADIITTMTTSSVPVFAGDWLNRERPIHINAMGAHEPWVREIDEHVVLHSRIVLDHRQQGLQEKGEILLPIAAGQLAPKCIHADLSQIVTGQAVGRIPETPWTLFLSGGTGVEDVAVASQLLQRARAKGVGTELDLNQPYSFDF